MEDPRMKIKSKTLTSIDILEHRAIFIKICMQAEKSPMKLKRFLYTARDS